VTESRFAKIDRKLSQRRILYVDIERQAGLAHIFDQRTSGFIPVARWVRRPSMLCFSAMWRGSRTVEFYSAWGNPAEMLEASWRLYDEADIVVGFNSVRFDDKWFRTFWRDNGLLPPRPFKQVDLYRVNKQLFGADSYSLAELCRSLGLPGKSGRYDPFEADRCMDGDEAAQKRMTRYSKQDTRILPDVHDVLLPWMGNHPHVVTSTDLATCERCGSADLKPTTPYTAEVLEYPMFRCGGCGGFVRSRSHSRRIAKTKGVKS
jgi:hypothetical protein